MLENLNNSQTEAVKNTEGPLLVLAGAGTGKTKVLISRIIYILSNYLAQPQEILAVTFTNKAAQEMKNRIGEIIGDQVNNLWVGTFHAIAIKILRRHSEIVGLRSDFTIIDEDDQNRLIKQILNDFNIDTKQFSSKAYLSKISISKDILKNIDHLNSNLPKLKEVYDTYQFRLKSMNFVDFGDIINYNLEIFRQSPETLDYYQNKFRYILVDEYQDTNNCQYQWLLLLSSKFCNICCVGDDDQSIYSWRGANINNILRFENDFVDAKIIRLEQNYRSTSNILKIADSVISNNKQRHGKKLWTEYSKGNKVKVLSFYDGRLESQTIANKIKNFTQNNGINFSQIAILVRAGYQTRSFEESFIQNTIPYKIIGGMKFYERLEIKDAIAYLRVCVNFDDDLALLRIINTPKRGVGDAVIATLYQKSQQEKQSFFKVIKNSFEENSLKGKSKETLKNLIEIFEKFNQKIDQITLPELAKSILSEAGYLQMWKNENTLEANSRLDNIDEFVKSLGEFSSIAEFLEYISLIEVRDDSSTLNSVKLMTIHSAKGLEFDIVFLPGLEEGTFPSSKSLEDASSIEEERRLMYVAITRAKKELIISFAKNRYIFGEFQSLNPSRFINEIPNNEIDFEEIDFANNNSLNRFDFNQNSSKFNVSNKSYIKNNMNNNFSKFGSFNYGSKTTQTKNSITTQKNTNKSNIINEEFSIGTRVFHQKFGYGKIKNVDGNKLEISFEKTGIKTVMKDFVTTSQ
jgi:DNA helicase-2/ATP-dependent DNA helicase PcrA